MLSTEKLSHFRCETCNKWWSVADAPNKEVWYCTWCGTKHEYLESTIESKVQLHERIKVYYAVTHYRALYCIQDGNKIVAQADGETIKDAINNLEKKLENYTLEQLRKM